MSEAASIEEVERRLVSKYAQLPQDVVAAVVRSAHAHFEQSRVRDFVPLLVERRAGHELSGRTQPAAGAL